LIDASGSLVVAKCKWNYTQ